jgi:hypothetical protein
MSKENAAEKLAEEHWEWLKEFIHPIYVDAMIHGYKHGYDDGCEFGKRVGSIK